MVRQALFNERIPGRGELEMGLNLTRVGQSLTN
jgi:hypothetical protein